MIRPRSLRQLAATRQPCALLSATAGPVPPHSFFPWPSSPSTWPPSSSLSSLSLSPSSSPLRSQSQSQQLPSLSRKLHSFPESQLDFQNGIPGFLSAHAFQLAWIDYQKLLISRLNMMLSGTGMEQDPPKAILSKVARDPSKAHIFNHASMIFNNHFFFSGLTTKPTVPPPDLQLELEHNFGSIENLHREMAMTGLAMFGPGFVWLVRVLDKRLSKASPDPDSGRMDLRILPTYLAGSPFAEAHWRRQGVDMNTAGETEWRQGPLPGQPMAAYQSPAGVNAYHTPRESSLSSSSSSSSSASGSAARRVDRTPPGGANVVPLLCLNTWEHVWLPDYGIGDGKTRGKSEFVQRWWRAVNWEQVSNLALPARKTRF